MDTPPETTTNTTVNGIAPLLAGAAAAAATMDDNPIFLIIPTVYSRIITVLLVLVVMIFYVCLVVLMTSYDTRFVPNYLIIWDFTFGTNTSKYLSEFAQFVRRTYLRAARDPTEGESTTDTQGYWKDGEGVPTMDSFVGDRSTEGRRPKVERGDTRELAEVSYQETTKNQEPVANEALPLPPIPSNDQFISSWQTYFTKMYNQLMLGAFVSGKKCRVTRSFP